MIKSISLWVWRVIDVTMAVILAAMIALVFANVVLRYGFSSGLRPSVELSRLGLVWVVMLGAAVMLRNDEHLAVKEFAQRFFPKLVPLLTRLAWLVILAAALMLGQGCYRQMMANWADISPLTGLPSALFYLAGFISAILMVLVSACETLSPSSLKTAPDVESLDQDGAIDPVITDTPPISSTPSEIKKEAPKGDSL